MKRCWKVFSALCFAAFAAAPGAFASEPALVVGNEFDSSDAAMRAVRPTIAEIILGY